MNIIWRPLPPSFSEGAEDAYIGSIVVGTVYFGLYTPPGTEPRWKGVCSLPGIKNPLGTFDDKQSAKTAVEDTVGDWFINMITDTGVSHDTTET